MLRKTIRFMDSAVNRIVAILCLLLFLICLYAMIDAVNVYLNANDKSVLKYKPQLGHGSEALGELSDDAVAWLTIDNTSIDYPVMQGRNNEEYINKDPFGEFSLSGSIFLDSRNRADFSDPYSILYGHHMEHGAMFGALDDFIKQEYFDQHRTGTLITTSGQDYTIRLFAACKADATEKTVFDPPDSTNEELLQYLKQHAAVFEPQGVDAHSRVLAMTTCQSAENVERMAVFGILTPVT
ncbi:class B sortase [Ruminococcus difficilis]|uniref:Class B sortase n=1 Tax=Ruminococcus difficilis TaxID=2763069 RepID=A0A934WSH9_9FIRM|nr:class B sortase [Ruminococcus difficilis]MBK6089106.1 class B sortase [Ruminococcus difficilis]